VDYLTEVVQYYREEMNITFRTVEPFNEPSSTEWQLGNIQERCHYDLLTQDSILQVCWPRSSHPVVYVTACTVIQRHIHSIVAQSFTHPFAPLLAQLLACLLIH